MRAAFVRRQHEPHGPVVVRELEPPDLEVAEFLIAHGANVHAANEYGVSLLQIAEREKKPEAVKLLLKHGAKKR